MTGSTMPGCALSNAAVERMIADERKRIADRERQVAGLTALLRARAAGDPAGWAEPRPGWVPAPPEPPSEAEAVLERITAHRDALHDAIASAA